MLIFFVFKSNTVAKSARKYIKDNKTIKEVGKTKELYMFGLNNSYYIEYPYFNNNNIDKIVSDYTKKIAKKYAKHANVSIFRCFREMSSKKVPYNLITYESYMGPDGVVGIVFNIYSFDNKGNIKNKYIETLNVHALEKDKLLDSYIFVGDYEKTIFKYIDNYLNNEYKNKLKNKYKEFIDNASEYNYVVTKDGIKIYIDGNKVLNKSKDFITISIPYSDIADIINLDTSKFYKKISEIKYIKDKFKKNKKDMYIKFTSNFYKNSSKNSKLIDVIDKGVKVEVMESSKVFSKIKYKTREGYVLNSYLNDNIVSSKGYSDVNEIVYATEDVSVRINNDENSDELVKLSRGDSITRIGSNDDGWSEVVYENNKGYVKSGYLSLVKPSDNNVLKINKNRNINVHGLMVALTFDDGPKASSTGRILDVLEKNHVVATFFDLGKLVNVHPEVTKREEAIGCEVGSHSYDHPNLSNLSISNIQLQVENSRNAFVSALGHDVSLFRAPYGSVSTTVKANIPYPLINWNVDTLDWKSKNKDAILNEVRKINNLDGKIVLMHSIYESTADAVEELVPELINKGYQLVTVSELAYYKGSSLNVGEVYYGF